MSMTETTATAGDTTPLEKLGNGRDSNRRAKLTSLAQSTLVFLGMLALMRIFVVQGFMIRSESMYETLLPGEVIVVSRAAFGTYIPFLKAATPGYSEPTRFDVIVFNRPSEYGGVTSCAKRIVGMPGDTLMMKGQTLYINGERVVEPYVPEANAGDNAGPEMLWQIPYLTANVEPNTYFPSRDNWVRW